MSNDLVISTPIGKLHLVCQNDSIVKINLNSQSPVSQNLSKLHQEIAEQFKSYFSNSAFKFDLEIERQATSHQEKVWRCLSQIPSGTVKTYGEIAKQIGSSAQAVGNACRHNPIPVIVPCHRVVAASNIGGFSGATDGRLLNIKRVLLEHEGVVV